MGLTITYGELRNPAFIQSFNKLSRFSGYKKFETKKRLYKIGKQLDKYLEEVADLHTKLVETYAEKNEDGSFVLKDDRPGTFKVAEKDHDVWKEALGKFDDTEVTLVDCKPVKSNDLDEVPINPSDLHWIDGFISMD